ncbi:MAG: hypothetical protein KR126chlam1_00375 [Chlamydiae bacterium]|nr:hypothetical protein [Chlamydiota bacterium]
MKLLVKLLLLALVIYYVPKFCHKQTDGFMIGKIHSHLPFDPRWEVEDSEEVNLSNLFSQPFTYLASGGQCYAFVSADEKYVVKFFKHHLRRLPFLVKHLPLPSSLAEKRADQLARRKKKLLRDFRSYKLAYEELKEETGLIFVHLNSTKDLNCSAVLIDKLGIRHTVNLDQVEFILQKKGTLALSYLDDLIHKGELEKAKEGVESLVNLVLSRCQKGIFDEDAKIHRNFGFVDGQAMLIDVGRLKPDPRRKDKSVQRADLEKIVAPLRAHLHSLLPELALHLNTYIEKRWDEES